MLGLNSLQSSKWSVAAGESRDDLTVTRIWEGSRCEAALFNAGSSAATVRHVVLFSVPHELSGASAVYGEGFQMLSQTGGTISRPEPVGSYTDESHYRLPAPPGAHSFYGLLIITPPGGDALAVAFSSCHRFSGRFDLYEDRLEAVLDLEGLEIGPGETWPLEEIVFLTGASREDLLGQIADRLCENHPPLKHGPPPSGWCSWYGFGPAVTARQILDNLDVIRREQLGLRYIQIDDGYQSAMGDWLSTGAAFGGGVQEVLREIRNRGFEPAIWVAPFIAEAASEVFTEHPDWFVQGSDGLPLRSDSVTFGGWRSGPWYVLDGTHPEVQTHLEQTFRTMRNEWGCTYFKLDACFWGAIHGGRLFDPQATRIEAYRRGMRAILRGAGDAFVLGCNHPLWPSLGLIHGSRSSGDIDRSWESFSTTARENLSRAWQNGRLWWNDPDCILLTGDLSDEEYLFHATVILASGGLVLSGDDLTTLDPRRLSILRKLLPPTGDTARLNGDMGAGNLRHNGENMSLHFNAGDHPTTVALPPGGTSAHTPVNFWTGDPLAAPSLVLPPHSALVAVDQLAGDAK